MKKNLTPKQVWAARGIALAADALQVVFLPLFFGGATEGVDVALDVVTAALLVWLCGFHPAFLPTFIVEVLPTADLFPTWTVATLFVTRRATKPEQLPPAREKPPSERHSPGK